MGPPGQTLNINTFAWKLRVEWWYLLAVSSQRSGCVLQPAPASADKSPFCLITAYCLISGCNRIQGHMLRALGPRENRWWAVGPCREKKALHKHLQTLTCTQQSHLNISQLSLVFINFILVPRLPDKSTIIYFMNN